MEGKKLIIPAPVSASGDDVTTWALPEGAIARLERGGVGDTAFSPDGHYLAVATKIGIWWYEIATMSPVALWETERGMISDIAFSPNGKWIAISNWDKVLKVWDVQRGIIITEIELMDMWAPFIFLPDNRWLAIGNSDAANVEVRQPETGEIVSMLIGEAEKGGTFMPIAFSPDAHLLASTSRDDTNNDAESIIVWRVESGEQVACLTGHIGCIYRLCFSPCGRFLASGGEEDGTVLVWDVGSWQQIKAYTGYGKSEMIPSYSPDGMLRVAAVSDGIVTVWDLENNEKLYAADSEASVTFFNGSQLAYQYGHEFLEVWTLDNPNPRRTIQTHMSFVDTSESLIFSQDGKTIAAEYRSGSALLWDVESKCSRPALSTGLAKEKQYLYTSTNGRLYIASIHKNSIKLWDIKDNSVPICESTEHETDWEEWVRPAFAPTVNLLACTDKGANLTIWDVQSGNIFGKMTHPLREFDPDEGGDPDAICHLAFNLDGTLLVSEAESGWNTRLWDVKRSEEIQEFSSEEISEIRGFSACGRYLVGSKDRSKNIVFWDTEHHEIAVTIQDRQMDNLVYSPCGSYLAYSGKDAEGILLWDLKRQEISKRLPIPPGCQYTHSLTFSSCGQYLAFGAAWETGLERVPIRLWEVETGKHIITFCGHTTDVQALAFSPNNELLASASYDGSILLWDLTPYL